MSKTIEVSKLTVAIKRLFNLYWKFMCTDEINDKIKMNLAPTPSATVTVFLIAEKLLKGMTLKFVDIQFVYIYCFVKTKRYYMIRLFCIVNLLGTSRILWILAPYKRVK